MSTIAVIGLGYVGLPLAVEFGKKMKTVGFDLSAEKVAAYGRFVDPTGEVSTEDLKAATHLTCSTDPTIIGEADFIIVAVPTPVDDAHQPDLSTVPYLLTGQRWILDNLQAQSATAVMGTFPPSRQNAAGNVVNGPQPRAQAWSLRQVDNAAWLSPDGSVEQAYFGKVSAYNWQWLAAKLPEWTAKQGEAFGWIPGAIGAPGVLSPWQQDYFATTTAAAAARGNQDARRVLEWQANFLVGRFTHEAQGFPPPFGVAFLLAAADPTTERAIEGNVHRTWRQMAEAQAARNLAGPGPWVNANYNQLALASLAAIRNVLGNAQALEVFRTLQARRIPGTSLAEVQAEPTFSIVPRDFTRAAAPLPACQPAAGRG